MGNCWARVERIVARRIEFQNRQDNSGTGKNINLINSIWRTLLTTFITRVLNSIIYETLKSESEVKGLFQCFKIFSFYDHCGKWTGYDFHRMNRKSCDLFINLRDLIAPHCRRSQRKFSEKNWTVPVESMIIVTLYILEGVPTWMYNGRTKCPNVQFMHCYKKLWTPYTIKYGTYT